MKKEEKRSMDKKMLTLRLAPMDRQTHQLMHEEGQHPRFEVQ